MKTQSSAYFKVTPKTPSMQPSLITEKSQLSYLVTLGALEKGAPLKVVFKYHPMVALELPIPITQVLCGWLRRILTSRTSPAQMQATKLPLPILSETSLSQPPDGSSEQETSPASKRS